MTLCSCEKVNAKFAICAMRWRRDTLLLQKQSVMIDHACGNRNGSRCWMVVLSLLRSERYFAQREWKSSRITEY